MKKLVRIAFVLVSTAAVACGDPFADAGPSAADGGAVAEPTPADAGAPPSPRAVDAGVGDMDMWEIPACAETSGRMHAFVSAADVEASVAGTWFRCSGGMDVEPAGAAGIEISGARASFLVRQGGTLVHGSSWDYERIARYELLPPRGGRIELSINPSVFSQASASTSEDGRFLELTETTSDGRQARYVRALPLGRAAPPQPVTDASLVEASCTDPLDPVHAYTSIRDVSTRIAGRWKVCSGGFREPTDPKGIEFTDLHAFLLVDSAAGLVPGPTSSYETDPLLIQDDATGNYAIGMTGGPFFSRISENGLRLELHDAYGRIQIEYARAAR